MNSLYGMQLAEAINRKQEMDEIRLWNGALGHRSFCPRCGNSYKVLGWLYSHLEKTGHYKAFRRWPLTFTGVGGYA